MKRDREDGADGSGEKKLKEDEKEEEGKEEEDKNEDDDDDDDDDDDEKEELKFAVVCSSNMNRSMEAHKQFEENNLEVTSFGVGNMVRLPAPNGKPLSFPFDTHYSDMKTKMLEQSDLQWFRDRGLLEMLDRNIRIKDHPERFQDYKDVAQFNVVFCFEERVFDILMKDLKSREAQEYKEMHVLNLDVKDDTKEATKGAQIALELCQLCVKKSDELEEALPEIIKTIEDKYKRPITHLTHYL